MTARPRNWVFLGDSLTEGIGSTRVTYVHDLVEMLRQQRPRAFAIHEIRLRDVDPQNFNPYIRTNLAGYFDPEDSTTAEALWVWNLASEGRTIEADRSWLPLLRNLQPEHIFIYRGSLESILRPAQVNNGEWPWWVPAGWRGFFSMDPRCYFSTTPIRRVKQTAIDTLKQWVRLRLLASGPASPLIRPEAIITHYEALLKDLATLNAHVHVLGLIGPDAAQFPGSPKHFAALNSQLQQLARLAGVDFLDWGSDVTAMSGGTAWRYRDGFHPNAEGAGLLARILYERIVSTFTN